MKKIFTENPFLKIILLSIFIFMYINTNIPLNSMARPESKWSYSGKMGIGTSYETYTNYRYNDSGLSGKISKVWFSIARGIITETAYQRIDKAQIKDLQFLVTGEGFFHEEKKHTTSRIEYVHTDTDGRPLSLSYKITNTPENNKYKFEKYIYTDPDRDVLFIHVNFTSFDNNITPYILLNPHMNNTGNGDTARVTDDSLIASENNTYLVLLSTTPFLKTSAGIVTDNDGWQDISKDGVMDWEFSEIINENVALTAQLSPVTNTTVSFDIAVGFGSSEQGAKTAAEQSLSEGWEQVLKKYNGEGNYIGWSDYLASLENLPDLIPYTGDNGKELYASALVLKAQEDKENAGALIASLSIPWGDTTNADINQTGYRAVWPRDFYQCASALLALGDRETPKVSFEYLKTIQVTDVTPGNFLSKGWFLQKTKVDGTLEWTGIQLDQTAMPVMLGWKLWKAGVLSNSEINSWYNAMLKPAAMFLKDGGRYFEDQHEKYLIPPKTPQERWEEQRGYSPSTTAAVIAGLLCAADIARNVGDSGNASAFEEKADIIEANIERYMYTTNGKHGNNHYYLRITEDSDPNNKFLLLEKNGAKNVKENEILDPGFLELVRYGIREATNAYILETLEEIDDMSIEDYHRIRYEFTFNGKRYPGFRRYGADGYGECTDNGKNFQYDGKDHDTQRGRVWPFLTGERGHYELERIKAENNGNITNQQLNNIRDIYVKGMEYFANKGLMLPEQIWDGVKNNDEHHFTTGEGTNSATPLAWTHAEYVKLLRSLYDRNIWDSYPNVREHFKPLSAYSKSYNRVFFRGTPNSWETTAMHLIGNYTWELKVSFPGNNNNSFKFDVFGDWSLNFGDNNNDKIGDQNGQNINVSEGAGSYTIRFNDRTKEYIMMKVSD